jgi:hypothetical protein
MRKEEIKYPIQGILRDIAQVHEIPISGFAGKHFLPKPQEDHYFPFLSDLSQHLAFNHKIGIEIEKDGMTAFEGSNPKKELSIAYFGRKVEKFSNYIKEHGLLYSHGRRIHLTLNENGNGVINLEDVIAEEAKNKLGADSFGNNSSERPKGRYFFRQGAGSTLPGVKEFLKTIIG